MEIYKARTKIIEMNFKYNVFDCICVNTKFNFSNLIKLASFIPLGLESHLEVSVNTFFFGLFICHLLCYIWKNQQAYL